MNTRDLSIDAYDYELPEERIAKYPLGERSASRLLLWDGSISAHTFTDLPDLLPHGAVLVRNNSRVIRARLKVRRPTGAEIEIFCLDPLEPHSYDEALGALGSTTWHCMTGNARRWRIGTELAHHLELAQGQTVELRLTRVGHDAVRFEWTHPNLTFGDLLESMGTLPIPPYLNRPSEASDLISYQTVYAEHSGSVAAPTAGLHFTPEVFGRLSQRGHEIIDVTLHVGAGTFRPVKADTIGAHDMHSELIVLERSTIATIRRSVGRLIAIGTTSIRTLESLYHLGRMLLYTPDLAPEALALGQWTAYDEALGSPEPSEVLDAILAYMDRHGLERLSFPTAILIAPGYRFRMVRGLITNFHQPRSTLLLLISALVGEQWRSIYTHALKHGYRFLSYGDSSLLLPPELTTYSPS